MRCQCGWNPDSEGRADPCLAHEGDGPVCSLTWAPPPLFSLSLSSSFLVPSILTLPDSGSGSHALTTHTLAGTRCEVPTLPPRLLRPQP